MRWLSYLNLMLITALVLMGALFFFHAAEKSVLPPFSPHVDKTELPQSAFAQTEDLDLGEGPLALSWVPPKMQLPDLRGELQFFGQNGRPDAAQGKPSFHIGLRSSGECRSVCESDRIYLAYQGHHSAYPSERETVTPSQRPLWGERAAGRGSYAFSPDNQPTPLWLEAHPTSAGALSLQVHMLDEKGSLVSTPEQLKNITLNAQDFPKSQTVGWELGGYRVDSTLLVRQKARWIGSDRFLEMHGGDDFSHIVGLERVDFFDGEALYSCFLGPKNFLVWKENRWTNPKTGESTVGLPLLCVRKIDEKILSLELWDAEGRAKTTLSLIRAKDHHKTPNLSHEFKFVGAKTWAQFIVECRNGERLTLKPHDWLVLTQDGWKKLDSPEEIDAYVEGRLVGPLFILDKMHKQNGHQVLAGHLFNSSRTDVEEIELQATPNTSLANYYRTIPIAPPIKPLIEGDEE